MYKLDGAGWAKEHSRRPIESKENWKGDEKDGYCHLIHQKKRYMPKGVNYPSPPATLLEMTCISWVLSVPVLKGRWLLIFDKCDR